MSTLSRITIMVCQRACEQLLRDNGSIRAAVMATSDGFEVCTLPAAESEHATQLAAMSSSMLALAEAMVREARMTECNEVLVECTGGRLLLLSVPVPEPRLVLCVASDRAATLGNVLSAGRACAMDVAKRLQG